MKRTALLLHVTVTRPEYETLVVWLPSDTDHKLTLRPSPASEADGEVQSLQAEYRCGDRLIDAVASYVRRGAMSDARLASSALVAQLKKVWPEKITDPNQAILAGYVLFKIWVPEAQAWIQKLATELEGLPDGQVMLGAQLIRQGS